MPHGVMPLAILPALRIACSAHSSRNTVEYVIYKLSKRLSNPSWVVVLKALMTFHRLLRECDSSFQDQVRPGQPTARACQTADHQMPFAAAACGVQPFVVCWFC